MELSIVLPAYQEARNLALLLPLIHQAARALANSYEILVVDSATPLDDTKEVCEVHCATYVPRKYGSSYGSAVRTGIAESRGDYVILMDADGSHNPNFLEKLWAERKESDLVIASRYVDGGSTENPKILIFMSFVVNVVFRFVLSLDCMDVSNSFRLYRGADVRRLNLKCDNFDIVEEILVSITMSNPGYRVKEIPFTFEKRKEGKTKRQLLLFMCSYVAVLMRLYFLKLEVKRRQKASALSV